MFISDKLSRSKIKDERMDLKKMAHFVIHTLLTFPDGYVFPVRADTDSLNNIAGQSRTKRKVNLESIACAEGQWFVLHSN